MRRCIFAIGIVLSVLLAGCSADRMETLLHNLLGETVEQETRLAAEAMLSGDPEKVKSVFSNAISGDAREQLFANIENQLPEIVPEPVIGDLQLVGAHKNFTASTGEGRRTRYEAVYEVEAQDGTWPLVSVTYITGPDIEAGVTDINFEPSNVRQSTVNLPQNIQLDGKRIGLALLATVNVIFIITTLVKIVRDRRLGRRWLWFLFALGGFWGIALNWTTGVVSPSFLNTGPDGTFIKLIDYTILGSGFSSTGPGGAWMLEIGLPLGAIIYWIMRKRRSAEPSAGNAASP